MTIAELSFATRLYDIVREINITVALGSRDKILMHFIVNVFH